MFQLWKHGRLSRCGLWSGGISQNHGEQLRIRKLGALDLANPYNSNNTTNVIHITPVKHGKRMEMMRIRMPKLKGGDTKTVISIWVERMDQEIVDEQIEV